MLFCKWPVEDYIKYKKLCREFVRSLNNKIGKYHNIKVTVSKFEPTEYCISSYTLYNPIPERMATLK